MIETINKLIRTSRYLVQELRPRADAGRDRGEDGAAARQGAQGPQDRQKEPISLETPIGEEEDAILATSSRTRASSRRPML